VAPDEQGGAETPVAAGLGEEAVHVEEVVVERLDVAAGAGRAAVAAGVERGDRVAVAQRGLDEVRVAGAVVGEAGHDRDDALRVAETFPTLNKILDSGGKPIIMAHLGRPKGKKDPKYTLAPVAAHLQKLRPDAHVTLAPDVTGPAAAEAVLQLRDGKGRDVLM